MNDPKITSKLLDLSDFHLISAHFEARSAPSYWQWDRAGAIWTEMITRKPELKLVQGEPTKIMFSLKNKYELSIYIGNVGGTVTQHILGTAYHPHQSLKDFNELLKTFIEIVIRHLEIAEYSRVGLRLIFVKNFSDRETASKALLSTNLIKVPAGPHFGIDGFPLFPEYSIRWEDGKKGATIRLRVEGIKMEFTPPRDWEDIEPFSQEKNRLVFDIDYYTLASVAVGQFSVSDWIDQGLHVINRDSKKFLRGA